MILTSGQFIADRYEVLESVGAGGMSDVYKCRDHVLGRDVAIKVLKEEFTEDTSFVSKFRSEAQSAAGLEHPNIVNIYDVGNENGLYYIVMEYVEGITLKTYIEKKGQLNYKEVISIAINIGRGIEAAHNKGIVHRDIKPQNIIISKEGKVKVTDFGIARAVSSNTINADVMGSVHYTSPEQARNGYVDFKSDIYSLGIIMYEMVTGRVPFDGDTTVAIAIQHLQAEMVNPTVYAPELPISLEKIILKATQKSPDRRYESMGDLLLDLKKALVNPNEDFVTMIDNDEADKTRVITADEVEQIKAEAGVIPTDEELLEEDDDDDKPLDPKMEKIYKIIAIVAGVIILAILVFIIGSFAGWFHFSSSDSDDTEDSSEMVEMPDLLGMTEDEAIEELKDLDLGYKVKEESSDDYDEGEVCDQSVDEGESVAKNTTITIYISTGKGSISVPNVVGMTGDAAKTKLQDAGFSVNREFAYSDSVASGQVISQSPSGGASAKEKDTITITISQGVESGSIPNVIGMSESAAKSKITSAGFSVSSVSSDYSDDYASGYVISQSKTGSAAKGSSVTLVVSKGSRPSSNSGTTE